MYINPEIRRKWQARPSQYVSLSSPKVENSDVYLYFSIICMGVLLACLSVEHVSAVLTKVKVIEGIKVTKDYELPWSVIWKTPRWLNPG